MALLPQLKRFLNEDFPDAPAWLSRLLSPLNLFMNSMYAALNNGLTLQDNFLGQINTMAVSGSSPTTQYLWKYQSNPVGVLIINTIDTSSSPAVITSAVTCDWSYSSGVITINNITNLDSLRTYSVTFLTIGG